MRRLALILSAIVVIPIVLFASCVSKDAQVTETYMDTEQKQEAYTAKEEYEIKTPTKVVLLKIENLSAVSSGFFLFNKDRDGSVRWSKISPGNKNPTVYTFKPEYQGRNHRISVVVQDDSNLTTNLLTGRNRDACDMGFKMLDLPIYMNNPVIAAKYMWLTQTDIDVFNAIRLAGYEDRSKWDKKEVSGVPRSADYLFDDMFTLDNWALIFYVAPLYSKISVYSTISLDYVYDIVRTGTREVIKYRQVPVQVEKQRTVTKTIQVPFWETMFSK